LFKAKVILLRITPLEIYKFLLNHNSRFIQIKPSGVAQKLHQSCRQRAPMFYIVHHLVFALTFLFSIASLTLLCPEISLLSTIALEVFPETFTSMHTQIQVFKGNTSGPPNLETMVSDDQHLHKHEPPESFIFRVPQNIL
jgi:hypothetical protein